MSFAENLQYLRKQKNITQEQLAEQLEVSRQSVSKWESGSSYPEMEKILQICSMFNCNMDTLMQGDISKSFAADTCNYDSMQNRFTKMVTIGVTLIFIGISIMCFMDGFGMAEAFSTVAFLAFVVVAIMLFVIMGLQSDQFKRRHPVIEDFYTEGEREKADSVFTIRMAVGIGLILLAVLWMVAGSSILETTELVWAGFTMDGMENMLTGSFFIILALAISLLVYGGMQKSKYDINEYNKESNKNNHASSEKKKSDTLTGKVCGCIFLIATAIYLGWSFLCSAWNISWIVFVIAGLLCAAAAVAFSKEE